MNERTISKTNESTDNFSLLCPAESYDAESIAKVIYVTWHECYQKIMPASLLQKLNLNELIETWRIRLRNRDEETVVCRNTGRIIGFYSICKFPEENSSYEIKRLYVLPEYWGKHIGPMLVKEAINHCKSKNCRSIIALILHNNERGIAFSKFYGFVHTGTIVNKDCFGEPLRLVKMIKSLL